MARAKPLGKGKVCVRSIDKLGRFLDDTLRSDDESAVEHRHFLDGLTNARVMQVTLRPVIAANGVKSRRLAMLQDLSRVADNEHCADRLAFAPFAANFHGQVNDGFERF